MTKTAAIPRHQLGEPTPARLAARLEAVPDTQLPDDERHDRGRWVIVGLVLLALVAAGGVWWLTSRGSTAETERDAAVGQTLDLAAQVAAACSAGQLAPTDRLCATAAQVQAQPIPGADGRDGRDGRGITGTRIASGRFLVSYTDGTTDDLGTVIGPPGADGRGIAGSTIEAGRLVLTFTDGARSDLGPVVGAAGSDGRQGDPGRGVAAVDVVDGRLLVRYDDGSSQDAGPLPAGPTGPAGPSCPDGSTLRDVTYGDGQAGVGCVFATQPEPTVTPEPTPDLLGTN